MHGILPFFQKDKSCVSPKLCFKSILLFKKNIFWKSKVVYFEGLHGHMALNMKINKQKTGIDGPAGLGTGLVI